MALACVGLFPATHYTLILSCLASHLAPLHFAPCPAPHFESLFSGMAQGTAHFGKAPVRRLAVPALAFRLYDTALALHQGGRLQQGCTSTATSSPSKKHRRAVITAMPIRVGTALPSLFASMGTYGFFCYAYSALKKFEQHAPRAAPCAEKFPMHSNAAVCTHRWSQRTGVDQTTRH